MTDRYTNNDIKLTLSSLRSQIRNGQVTLYFRALPGRPAEGGNALRKAVANAFGFGVDDFNTENFNPQTLKRFAKLFDVPTVVPPMGTLPVTYPSNDEAAWAIQNFINRRADPWSHIRVDTSPVLATEVSPINV